MSARTRLGALLAAALAALALWHALLRAHGRGVPLITDEGEYAVAARIWSEGGLPYRDAFSQKPPMTLLAYRLARTASSSPEAARVLAASAGIGTILALFLMAPRNWSPGARLSAPAAFSALAALPIGDYGFPANTETFVNLFAALAALLLLARSPLAAGVAAGAALCSKQTAAWSLLALAAAAAWLLERRISARRSRGAILARFIAGSALAPAGWALYFAEQGGFAEYWDAVWRGNTRYAAALLNTGSLGEQLSWFARALLPRLALFCAPALGLAFLGLKGLRAGPQRRVETLGVLWLGGAAAGALTGLFLFPHYFLVLAPPLALLAAAGAERLGPRRALAAAALLALWPALLAPRLLFASAPRERASALLHPNPLFETKELGEELRRRARPGDRLHVFGSEGALFVYSGLRPATKHTLSYALTLFPKDAAAVDAELAALESASPRFVIWSTQPLSTMISSTLGLRYRDGLARFLARRRYRFAGRIAIGGSFRPGGAPELASEDQLLLFERP